MRNEVYFKQLENIVVDKFGFELNKMIVYKGYGLTIGQYLSAVSERDKTRMIKSSLNSIQKKEAMEFYIKGAISGVIERVLSGEPGYAEYYKNRLNKVI